MEKKNYVTPQAVEEAFVANCYVAKCTQQVTGNNGMQCTNPTHSHYWNGTYFAHVWIDAPGGNICDVKVTSATPRSNGTTKQGDWFLFADGHSEQATIKYNNNHYVPASYDKGIPNGCYGQYIHDGSYIDQVLS